MAMDELYPSGLPDPLPLPMVMKGVRREKRRELIKALIREVAHDSNFNLADFVTSDQVEDAVIEAMNRAQREENFLTMEDLERYMEHDLDLSDYVKEDDLEDEIGKVLDDNDLVQKSAMGVAEGLMKDYVLRRDYDITAKRVGDLINNFTTAHGLLSDWMRTLGFWRRMKLVFFGRV